MTSAVHQAREALGRQLRDIRKGAGLSGKDLAALAGWANSKISKLEYGKQAPTEGDIRVWCAHCDAVDQATDLIASMRHIEAMYVEWRRMLGLGMRRRQLVSKNLEAHSRLLRWYEPLLVPGLLHTADYARTILARVVDFYGVPDDVEAAVVARMERQQVLYSGDHRFHFILAEQVLRTEVGAAEVMIGQLDRLLTVLSLSRVSLGVLPTRTAYRVPTNQFILYDDRLVHVETVSAELAISQPREVALYVAAFQELAKVAVYGRSAKSLIERALVEARSGGL